jgi:hypothetical protein
MSDKRSKFQGLFDAVGEDAASEPESAPDDAAISEDTKARTHASKKARRHAAADVVRIKTNYKIRQDYQRKLKNIANDEGRKVYQVLEEAISRYLKAKGRL